MAALEDRRVLQRKRSVTSPPIKSRTTKLPIEAATTVTVLLGELVEEVGVAGAALLEGAIGVDEGGPSDLSVLLAMFTSKISDACILFA